MRDVAYITQVSKTSDSIGDTRNKDISCFFQFSLDPTCKTHLYVEGIEQFPRGELAALAAIML